MPKITQEKCSRTPLPGDILCYFCLYKIHKIKHQNTYNKLEITHVQSPHSYELDSQDLAKTKNLHVH